MDCLPDVRRLSSMPAALFLALWLASCATQPTPGQPQHEALMPRAPAVATSAARIPAVATSTARAPAVATSAAQIPAVATSTARIPAVTHSKPGPVAQETEKHAPPLPASAFELALSADDYWLSYRHLLRPQGDYGAVEWFGDDDHNYLVSARIMRFTKRDKEFPLTFGVGLGFYGAFQDRPSYDAYALSLRASAHYNFDTQIPTHAGISFAYAPDITTFSDGKQLIDGEVNYGVQISSWAATFLAYRYTEVEWTNNTDHLFTNQVHIGVRLAW